MDSNMKNFECRNCKHDLQMVSVQHCGATQILNQEAGRIEHGAAALHTSMPPPEQPLQRSASEDFLLGQNAAGDGSFPWDYDISMELDSLRAAMSTPMNGAATAAQMNDAAAAPQMNGATEDYSLDFPAWSEPASSGSTSDISAVFSRLDRLELMMTQTRVNIVSVELGLKALSHDLLEGKRDRERSAGALEKLMNGLDKFMCHVAQRLDGLDGLDGLDALHELDEDDEAREEGELTELS